MSGFDTNARLAEVLADVFSLPVHKIVPELTKADVGSWDSLKQMDLVMSLEKEFGITLEIPDIVAMDSVEKVIEVLESKGVDLGA
jgi:acyl carrier protein